MDSRIVDVNSGWWGVSLEQLMENAGEAVARECRDYQRIIIFCGRGNNGGDGYVAARYLLDEGKQIKVYGLSGGRSKLCQRNYEAIKDEVILMESSADVKENLDDFELIVDA
ncbi:MAG: bifunctional ADP-dependent NAD(P)H-hydrate dehydratase/NAD(P)H-hydrate epimerase, partial [Candidatus Altiarchaeales archaeon]|nr:bifunctional ADP-dependent NAD(P)H-hydrate dehydratase/NAD(P)H-hydrate epimerase [Candidatus Altiarchaeales archaeon]